PWRTLRGGHLVPQRFVRPMVLAVSLVLIGGVPLVDLLAQAPAAPTAPAGARGAGAPQGPGFGGRGGGPVVIGDPAPVPPQVLIPRPTPDELATVNAAVRTFIDTNQSSAAPLLKKFESLLVLQPPRLNVAATFTQTVQRRGPRHEGFVERA